MKLLLFLVLGVPLSAGVWIGLAFVMFMARGLTHVHRPPEWHQQPIRLLAPTHLLLSLLLGFWIAYRLVLR